jgi:hypothetical protein
MCLDLRPIVQPDQVIIGDIAEVRSEFVAFSQCADVTLAIRADEEGDIAIVCGLGIGQLGLFLMFGHNAPSVNAPLHRLREKLRREDFALRHDQVSPRPLWRKKVFTANRQLFLTEKGIARIANMVSGEGLAQAFFQQEKD